MACCAFTGIAGELAAKETTAQKERDDDISQLVYRCRVFDDTGTVGTWNKCGLVLKVRTQKRI